MHTNSTPAGGRDGNLPPLPLIELAGTAVQMGEQLGEQRREEVHAAVALVLDELSQVARIDDARRSARAYLEPIGAIAPRYVDEIRGLARGARISLEDALLLQLRFEAVGYDAGRSRPLSLAEGCSAFAMRAADARLTGQNVDIPPAHVGMGQIVRMRPTEGPELLFYTYYAGLLGYLGINSEGLSVFGNALLSPGWRVGFPRYFVLRLALEQRTVADVERMLRSVRRASTINLLVTDRTGAMADFELTVDDCERLGPEDGCVFHTNHYLAERFAEDERLLDILPDSPKRYAAGRAALTASANAQRAPFERAKALLTDHTHLPGSICRHAPEHPATVAESWVTVASLIAMPDDGVLYATRGNPCRQEYARYALVA